MRARVWLSVVMLVAGTGLLAAAALAGPAQKRGGTLRLARTRDFDSLDPAIGYLSDTWKLEFATCAKLYNYPDKPVPEGARVIPEVAKSFPKVSKDGKTQTIELKRSYGFHTGQRITAANFVAAINRDASPMLQSPAAQYLHEIAGADAVISGRARTISGVKAAGAYQLRIRTTRPLFDLVSRLTMPFFCPLPTSTPLEEIDNPPGSGPYYIASHVPNRQVVLKRNRFYRGQRPANVDQVVWTLGVGFSACEQGVERNELDECAAFPRSDAREIAAKYGVNRKDGRFFFNPVLGTSFFAFNHDRPGFKGPGQIPRKQAINWALDRRALVATTGYLGGKRTDQILPPAMGRDESIYPLGPVTEQRLVKARALLAKARFRPKALVLYVSNLLTASAQAQIFQFNLKRLGIDVEIKYFPPGAPEAKASTRGEPYDVLLSGWGIDYADPISFFVALDGTRIRKTGNTNSAYFDRPQYNREIARIGRMSGEARREAWAALDLEMMRNDPPWAPFLNFVNRDFVSKSFGCYVFNPVFSLDIAAACKK